MAGYQRKYLIFQTIAAFAMLGLGLLTISQGSIRPSDATANHGTVVVSVGATIYGIILLRYNERPWITSVSVVAVIFGALGVLSYIGAIYQSFWQVSTENCLLLAATVNTWMLLLTYHDYNRK